jgi:hypothetical protein
MLRRSNTSLLAGLAAASLAPSEADAQGGVACVPLNGSPTYAFEKVIDAAEAFPLGLIPNDRGHALIHAVPEGATSGTCLLVHRGATTEPIVCTRNIDATSPFTSIGGGLDWNERGTIAVGGTLHGSFPGSGSSHIQLIEPNGSVFALPTFDLQTPTPKSRPAITGEGDVFYFDGSGSLQRFAPALPGDDKSETVVSGTSIAIMGVEPAGAGKLYFSATNRRVGTVQNALGPVQPPSNPLAPYFTAEEITDAISAPTPSRFGAIAYFTATDIRKRFDVGGPDYVAGDPELVIERFDAPLNTAEATLVGPCRVALRGTARGLCNGGPSDRFVCDPDASPDPCGGAGAFCEDSVSGVFVWQAGSYAAVAREDDSLFGSEIQNFVGPFGPEVFRGSNAGHLFFGVHLADGRDLVVRADPPGGAFSPALPTSCASASCRFGLQPQGWLGVSPNGVPLYFDPDVATGYDYTLDPGDPLFASVMVPEPLPNGDESFTLHVGQQSFPLAAGEQFDLTQIAPLGVAAFSIRDIDPGEELDPEDPMAFVTGVTFMEERAANVTMTAFVPEPGATAAGVAVLGVLASLSRRARQAPPQRAPRRRAPEPGRSR